LNEYTVILTYGAIFYPSTKSEALRHYYLKKKKHLLGSLNWKIQEKNYIKFLSNISESFYYII